MAAVEQRLIEATKGLISFKWGVKENERLVTELAFDHLINCARMMNRNLNNVRETTPYGLTVCCRAYYPIFYEGGFRESGFLIKYNMRGMSDEWQEIKDFVRQTLNGLREGKNILNIPRTSPIIAPSGSEKLIQPITLFKLEDL